jgi:hypothetical protein
MNPIQELDSKIKLLHEELDGTPEQKKLICFQHKKILMHVIEMMSAMSLDKVEDRFKLVKGSYTGFNDAIIEAQRMGEKMEKGLQQRSKFMTEEQERSYKKNKKTHF